MLKWLNDDWFRVRSYHLCGWSFWRTCITKHLHLSTKGARRYRTNCVPPVRRYQNRTHAKHRHSDSSACWWVHGVFVQFGWIVDETGAFRVLWVLVNVPLLLWLWLLLLSGTLDFNGKHVLFYSWQRCATVEWYTWIWEIGDTFSVHVRFIQRIEFVCAFSSLVFLFAFNIVFLWFGILNFCYF